MCTGSLEVNPQSIIELGRVLCGDLSMDLDNGKAHLRVRRLPWGTPAAAMIVDGEVWVIYDGDQSCARRHARALLRECAERLNLGDPCGVSPIYGAIPIPRPPVRLGLVS